MNPFETGAKDIISEIISDSLSIIITKWIVLLPLLYIICPPVAIYIFFVVAGNRNLEEFGGPVHSGVSGAVGGA